MKKIFLTMVAVAAFAAASFAQGCVYPTDNVTINFKRKIPGQLDGNFTINSSGDKVAFSQGNLQYNSVTQKWQFAEHQYDYIGNTTGNTSITNAGKSNNTGVADLFGWVGASSTWADLRLYGLTSSKEVDATNGYGNSNSESLKRDWGKLAISNGGNTENSGWRTLTIAEWCYLLDSRTGSSNTSTIGSYADVRFAKATVNGKQGLIIFPDGGTFALSEFTQVLPYLNESGASFGCVTCSSAQWEALEEKGCVFLPAAGYRMEASVSAQGTQGFYWSSSPDSRVKYAADIFFDSSQLIRCSEDTYPRWYGHSVRLVKNVE